MGLVLQEADMTQLVDLVIADGLRTEQTGRYFRFASDAAMTATPAPGKVILDVEANS